MKKQTTNYKQHLEAKKQSMKEKLNFANQDGDSEAFRYYFHQIVKIQAELNRYNYKMVQKGA